MQTPYDVNIPIVILYGHIEEGVEFSELGKILFTPKQIVDMLYDLFFKLGLFQDECKIWRKLPDID